MNAWRPTKATFGVSEAKDIIIATKPTVAPIALPTGIFIERTSLTLSNCVNLNLRVTNTLYHISQLYAIALGCMLVDQ